jgi:hypothetical protein
MLFDRTRAGEAVARGDSAITVVDFTDIASSDVSVRGHGIGDTRRVAASRTLPLDRASERRILHIRADAGLRDLLHRLEQFPARVRNRILA